MTKAWTSIPFACASAIKSCSGSKPAAIGTKSGAGSRELRYQESPRRRTCAKIAFALAALALFTTARMSLWLLSVVLKVSTQKARYWLTLCADALTDANDSPIKSRVERQTIQIGWPPGMRPRLVRFRMVVPPKLLGAAGIGLIGPIGLIRFIESYRSYESYKPYSRPPRCRYRGAKNCS